MIIAKIYPSGKLTWYRPRIINHPGVAREPSFVDKEKWRWNACIMRWHGIEAAKKWHLPVDESGAARRLVNTAKFQRPVTRKRSRVLSANGAQRLRDGAALMQTRHNVIGYHAFDTLTFPPQFDGQHSQERLSRTINNFMTRLRQEYAGRGIELQYQYVIEIHPRRSHRENVAVPHVHLLRNGAKKRFQWFIHYSVIADIWRESIESNYFVTGDEQIDWRAATRTEWVRQSVGAYMAKYLEKGRRQATSEASSDSGLLLTQWWGQSRALLRLIKLHIKSFKGEQAINLLRFCGHRERDYLRWELELQEGESAIAGSFSSKTVGAITRLRGIVGKFLRDGGRSVPDLYFKEVNQVGL